MAEKVGDFYGLLGMRVDAGSFATANKILSTVKTAVAAFVGFEITKGIIDTVGSVIELGGKINDQSAKTGVAAETLQEYTFAAGLASVGNEELVGSLGKLNKGLAELKTTGKGNAADGLKSIGIALNDPAVKAQNLDEILLEIADKFQEMPDGPKKVAAAMDLFGKSGASLIPFLNQGGDGINRLKQEARELGVVIDNDTIASLDDLGDNVDRLKAGWQGVKNQAVAAILPLLSDLMPGLISSMKDAVAWTREHKDEIREFVSTTGRAIKYVIQALIVIGQAVAKVFKAVGTVIGEGVARFVLFIQSIGREFASAWEWVKSSAQALWDRLSAIGGGIADVFRFVADKIKAVFKAAFDWVEEKVRWLVDKVQAAIDALNAGAKKTLDRLGVKPEDQSTAAKAAATGIDIVIPSVVQDMLFGSDAGSPSAPTSGNAPSLPAGVTGQPLASNVDVGGININVQPGPGMDEKQLAARVGEVVDERMSQVFRHAGADNGVA